MQAEDYMRRALELARQAEGDTSPNPLVGCVLTDEIGNIVGEGYHHRAGEPHAEVMALRAAAEAYKILSVHTAYVNLEPCCHCGRTGPCADALISAGVKRVVCAMTDPNPLVAGGGIARLRAAGVTVQVGVLEQEARFLNRRFIKWITTGKPFVTLKFAQTLDGRLGTANGDSQWITSEEARTEAHALRRAHDAVLVGIGTVISDDCELTTRQVVGRSPVRIILDSKGRIPLSAKVLQGGAPTIIIVGEEAPLSKVESLSLLPSVEVWHLPAQEGKINLEEVLEQMAKRQLTSLLVEGGSEVLGSFYRQGLYDEVNAFIAPKIMGGNLGKVAFPGKSAAFMDECGTLHLVAVQQVGSDAQLIMEKIPCSQDS